MIVSRKVLNAVYLCEIDMPIAGHCVVLRMWRDDSENPQRGAMSFWMIESYRADTGSRTLTALLLGPPGKSYPEELDWAKCQVTEVDNPRHVTKYGTEPPPGDMPSGPVRAPKAGKKDLTDEERRLARNEASRRCREKKKGGRG